MASKLGILVVAFLSIIFLPLLSSAFFHRIHGVHPHRHRHRHRLFRPIIFPKVENQQENENNPIFLNPALDNEPQINEEPQLEEGGENGDNNEKIPIFLNPVFEEGKNEKPRGEEGRGNGDHDNEKTSLPIKESKNEEPQPEQPRGAEGRGNGRLREAFYEQSCPQAEKIANETIHKHFSKDPSLAPAFVRLFFHDCFVTVRPSCFFLLLHFFVILLDIINT